MMSSDVLAIFGVLRLSRMGGAVMAVLVLAISGCAPAAKDGALRKTLSLDGTWAVAEGKLDQVPTDFSRTAPVPGLADLATPAFAPVPTSHMTDHERHTEAALQAASLVRVDPSAMPKIDPKAPKPQRPDPTVAARTRTELEARLRAAAEKARRDAEQEATRKIVPQVLGLLAQLRAGGPAGPGGPAPAAARP